MGYAWLEKRFSELEDLTHIYSICSWDEQVIMAVDGGEARAQALASLQSIKHQRLTDPEIASHLAQADKDTLSAWQQANLARMQVNYNKATCVPDDLVEQAALASLKSEQAWRSLRSQDDWKSFLPLLQKTFDYQRQIGELKAEALGLAPYDAMLDDYSPGVTQAMIDPIFAELRSFLPDFIKQTQQRQAPIVDLQADYPIESQRRVGLQIMEALGFDFKKGRLDVSHHPFCGGVPTDVRLTTRYKQHEFISSLMGVCHETGHALYEQGLPLAWQRQPVGQALGMAVHESQSLLIEMQACRSIAYAEFILPLLQAEFSNLKSITAEDLYAALIQVKPGFIRVDADELTYPLHVILRYEIERDLMSGKLTVAQLPERWEAGMQDYLGLSVGDKHGDGVMQDVHWPSGAFGYFPAYTLGRLIAAQLYRCVEQDCPQLPDQIREGNFSALVAWLRDKVHQHASSNSMQELLIQATGAPLSCHAFIEHVQTRYG